MKEFSYVNIVFYILLIVANSLTHEKLSGLLVSLPEIIIVVSLLLRNKIEKAFFWHLVFTITCLAIPFSQITNPEDAHYGLFNYSKLKLVGPVGVYHLILLLLFFKAFSLKISVSLQSLFYSLYKTIIYLAVSGIFLGIVGLIFFDYYFEYFILYTSYIITLFLTIFVLIRMPFTSFISTIYKMLLEVMMAAPIAALIVYLFGFTSQYGDEKISIILEVVYYSMALVFAYYHLKNYALPLFSFFITVFLLFDGGMGGKGIIFMGIVLVTFLLLLFNKNTTGFNIDKRKGYLKMALIPILLVFVVKFASYIENAEYNLFLYKLENVTLLINLFQGIEGIYLIPESPRVRIIEVMSIFNELFRNPIYLFFGKGYGSYFSDDFNLLANLNLTNAYKAIEINSNKYGGVHDSFSSIPLANGLFGTFLVSRLVYLYVKRIKTNFMAYAAIPWLAFTFYYNVQFGIVALLLLYSSEMLLYYKNEDG